ncbi:hypothetical protein Pfo_022842 [Paulownia fortunei]|nr:hypothetical protein Pfo_022842 [Paulownia fortunei]
MAAKQLKDVCMEKYAVVQQCYYQFSASRRVYGCSLILLLHTGDIDLLDYWQRVWLGNVHGDHYSAAVVVAAKDQGKQAVPDDMKPSAHQHLSWFICNDDQDAIFFILW